ncbi:hypothetical protein [Nonomuraea dietziae]|uniref:hypothetical protein n=1 Tax=Nonomuraea dietziae TaxID=65515 RepID=UPI00336C8FDD
MELAAMGETHLTEEHAEVVRFSHRAARHLPQARHPRGPPGGRDPAGRERRRGTLTQLFDRGGPLPGDRAGLLFPGAGGAAVADSPVRMPTRPRSASATT